MTTSMVKVIPADITPAVNTDEDSNALLRIFPKKNNTSLKTD
jgi:hypothetical protein